jgi:hypothetical protein
VRGHDIAEGGDQTLGFLWIQPGARLVEEYDFRARGKSLSHLDEAAGAQRQPDDPMLGDFPQFQ